MHYGIVPACLQCNQTGATVANTIIAICEGVESTFLRQLAAGGALPWWEEGFGRGAFRLLDCGPVPYEPTNLATALSGRGPGFHGCFSYWATQPDEQDADQKPRVLTSDDVKVPRVWEWEEARNARFGVVNVQLTSPPKPLNGVMVSYLMGQSLRATYPADYQIRLSRKGVRFAHDVSCFYRGEAADAFAAEATRVAALQLDTALAVGEECDVLIVNLTLADRLSHFLWREVHEYRRGPFPAIFQSYAFLGSALARLEEAAGPRGTMLVFSEMGFGHLAGFQSLNDYLRRAGLQALDQTGEIDIRRSVACETAQGSHGIALLPWAARASNREELLAQVVAALRAAQFPEGGLALAAVHRREDLYDGPQVNRAPDLIVEPADLTRPPLGDPRWARHVHRHLQTGWHRPEGFCLTLGRRPEAADGPARLTQIAPTIARMAGFATPAEVTDSALVQ